MRSLHAVVAAVLLLVSVLPSNMAAQCNRTQCNSSTTCDTGYGVEVCTNATSTYVKLCFYIWHCSAYSEKAGDVIIFLRGPSPNQVVNRIKREIQDAIITAYNKFCRTDRNYLICCPGSVSWQNKEAESASVTAMSDIQELPIVSVIGAIDWTTIVLRLLPNRNSSLCSRLTYASTTLTASTPVSIKAIASVTSSSSSLTETGPSTMKPKSSAAVTPYTKPDPVRTSPSTADVTPYTKPDPVRTHAVNSTQRDTNTATRAATKARTTSLKKSNRRRRDFEDPGKDFDVEQIISREKRATPKTSLALCLSVEAIQNISSGINISGIVETVLLSYNITAKATVSVASDLTTISLTTSPAGIGKGAIKTDCHHFVLAAAILLLVLFYRLGEETDCFD